MSERKFPMKGLEVWRNDKNKFCVFQAHYTAHTKKRSDEFKEEAKSGMPYAQFLQEYEINWDTFEGLPVFRDYNPRLHERERIAPELGLPLLVGMDFGLTPGLIVCQLQSSRLVVLREWVAFNMGVRRFLEWVIPEFRVAYPRWGNLREDVLCWIDPAGWAKAQSDETTCAQEVGKYFKPRPGGITWEDRRRAVEHFLCRSDREGPLLQVDKGRCPMLAKGFAGGYRYKENVTDTEPEKLRPWKNEYSHIHDSLQMVCTGIAPMMKKTGVKIPNPSYTFGKR